MFRVKDWLKGSFVSNQCKIHDDLINQVNRRLQKTIRIIKTNQIFLCAPYTNLYECHLIKSIENITVDLERWLGIHSIKYIKQINILGLKTHEEKILSHSSTSRLIFKCLSTANFFFCAYGVSELKMEDHTITFRNKIFPK